MDMCVTSLANCLEYFWPFVRFLMMAKDRETKTLFAYPILSFRGTVREAAVMARADACNIGLAYCEPIHYTLWVHPSLVVFFMIL